MLTHETILTFFAASIILALAPGPDNIFVLTQSALRGKLAGIAVVIGLCTGLIVHTTAVAFGVAVIFQTSELAFAVLKYIGAGYLIFLAWQAFKSSSSKIQKAAPEEMGLWKLYRRGIIMNITNPKVSVFFLAFLPQFADPSKGSVSLQILLLGGLFIFATLLIFSFIALMGAIIGKWFNQSDFARKIMSKITGVVFICLAIKLVTSEK